MFVSICLDRVVSQLSHAIAAAIPTSHPRHTSLWRALSDLAGWSNRPKCLRLKAYEWCSAICKGYQNLEDGKILLLASLKIGFRDLNPDSLENAKFVHTEHHRHMADIVFNNGDGEAIADLLEALVGAPSRYRELLELLGTLPGHLVSLRDRVLNQRLRKLVIGAIGYLGPEQLDQVGVEEFTMLLERLKVGINDVDARLSWLEILLLVVKSPQGRDLLPHSYWELIPRLSARVSEEYITSTWKLSRIPGHPATVVERFSVSDEVIPIDENPKLMSSLLKGKRDTLEYLCGSVWLLLSPDATTIPEALEDATRSLFREQPGAVQKLRQWSTVRCRERLQRFCKQENFEELWKSDAP